MALTKSGLKKIGDLFAQQDKKYASRLVKLKSEFFEKIDQQEQKFETKLTEFKSDFFEKIDPILKEVTTAREERPLIENRIEALEEIHPEGKHVPTLA